MQLADVPGVICDGSNIAVVVMDEEADNQKPKINIDKNKLFSQMNDKFAKDTHNALKHRPVYQKRNRQLPSPDGKEEKEEYKVAREHVKDHLYQNIAVNVGNPGDLITGNSFVACSGDHARDVICELADEDIEVMRTLRHGVG